MRGWRAWLGLMITVGAPLLSSCAKGTSCDEKCDADSAGASGAGVGGTLSGAGPGGASAVGAAGGNGTAAAGSSGGSAGTAVPPVGSGGAGVAGTSSAGASAAGSAAAGSSAGGAGADSAPVTLKEPVTRGNQCVLELGDLKMEAWALEAGRIRSLRVGDRELLTGPQVHAMNYGSTFWTSPQADWSWPPITAIDSAPFTVMSPWGKECLIQGPMVSDPAHPNVDGVQIEKHFSADEESQTLIVKYSIVNRGTSPRKLAPWEVTRVAPGGLTFYRSGSQPTGDRKPATMSAQGCVWLEHTGVAVDSKLFGDGKGWLAHVTADGVLLLKVFEDVAAGAAAPGEAEVELYSGAGYDEIEAQGSYAEIPAGGRRDWTVRWIARPLPTGTPRTAGSPELLAWVESLL